MKKFKIFYIIISIITIAMIITKGFSSTVYIPLYNDSDFGMTGGFQKDLYLSMINAAIVLVIIILLIIVTINKNNNIRNKWLLLIGLIFLSMFIPIGIYSCSSGYNGIVADKNVSVLNIGYYLIIQPFI